MKIKKTLLISTLGLALLGVFFCSENVLATEVLQKGVLLDEATIERGYTLQTNDAAVRVGIQPNTFYEPAWVKIKSVEGETLNAPTGKQFVSDVYVYDIRVENPQVLPKLVWLALSFESTNDSDKQIAFYNRVSEEWQFVPTKTVGSEARAGLPFPYSKVAVFENQINAPDEPTVSAISAIVIDEETGEILWQKNANEVRSIASLTKLITAWVFLDSDPDFNSVYVYDDLYDTNPVGAHLYVVEGDVFTLRDTFYSMLVGSANNAAKMIGYNTPNKDFGQFVAAMNDKADELGLEDTSFAEPSGLNPANQSTAYEYALLARQAFKKARILAATTISSYYFEEISSADWRTTHNITSGNQLLGGDLYITGSKTGYLDESGYCFVVRVKDRYTGNEVIVVTLGNTTKIDRWSDVQDLVEWGLYTLNNQ